MPVRQPSSASAVSWAFLRVAASKPLFVVHVLSGIHFGPDSVTRRLGCLSSVSFVTFQPCFPCNRNAVTATVPPPRCRLLLRDGAAPSGRPQSSRRRPILQAPDRARAAQAVCRVNHRRPSQ